MAVAVCIASPSNSQPGHWRVNEMTILTIATTQMACTWDLKHNVDQAEQ